MKEKKKEKEWTGKWKRSRENWIRLTENKNRQVKCKAKSEVKSCLIFPERIGKEKMGKEKMGKEKMKKAGLRNRKGKNG
ncbi:TPA: hypothetical protein HA351_01325 [Methanosarcinaceae archaeon]|nr:hypothetical protein [Methanosarcinaceae archaeon]